MEWPDDVDRRRKRKRKRRATSKQKRHCWLWFGPFILLLILWHIMVGLRSKGFSWIFQIQFSKRWICLPSYACSQRQLLLCKKQLRIHWMEKHCLMWKGGKASKNDEFEPYLIKLRGVEEAIQATCLAMGRWTRARPTLTLSTKTLRLVRPSSTWGDGLFCVS